MEKKEVKILTPKGWNVVNAAIQSDGVIVIFEEIEPRLEPEVKTWDDLVKEHRKITGYYIDVTGDVNSYIGVFSETDINIFYSQRLAYKALAMAQISQLMPYYGGMVTDEEWLDESIPKYTIRRKDEEVTFEQTTCFYDFFAFHTSKQQLDFYENNKQLVKYYLMLG